MKTHILKGSKQEIVDSLARLTGEVREAIVFVDDQSTCTAGSSTAEQQDMFAEMRPYMVNGSEIDDSRAAIYSPMEGE
jgi:hypothetical protein